MESQDLKRVFEDVTGQNLEWFFDQWVYTGGLPELEIKYKYNRRNKHVKLTIRQTHMYGPTQYSVWVHLVSTPTVDYY